MKDDWNTNELNYYENVNPLFGGTNRETITNVRPKKRMIYAANDHQPDRLTLVPLMLHSYMDTHIIEIVNALRKYGHHMKRVD